MSKVKIIYKNKESDIEKLASDTVERLERELGVSFDSTITIRLHDSRNSYEKQLDRSETYSWEVGNSSDKNEIDILHPEVFEKESSHPKSDFDNILKHELAHIFINKLSDNKAVPMWLNEGLSMVLSGQTDKYKNEVGLFAENNYSAKIATQYGWSKYSNFDAYKFSCLFVNYLREEYSLKKVIELIKSIDKNYYEQNFIEKFKTIFNLTPEEAERRFLQHDKWN